MKNLKFSIFALTVLILALPSTGLGRGGSGSGHSLGISLGYINSSQGHMNMLISRANLRDGGISAAQLNTAYEGALQYGYRFSGSMIATVFRPSYFYQVTDGTGASGSYDYRLTGFTVFQLARLYPLENEFMRFFLQLGPGFGFQNGRIREGSAEVQFSGSTVGALVGMGAEFCFGIGHCVVTEGNLRFLPIVRNIANSSSGTFATDSLSQAVENKEVEIDDSDFQTTFSGIQFLVGYVMNF